MRVKVVRFLKFYRGDKMIKDTFDSILNGNCMIKNIVVAKAVPIPKTYVYEKGSKMHDRLFYILDGCFFITEKGQDQIVATKGSLIFLPADTDYVSSWTIESNNKYISLNFSMYNNCNEDIHLYDKITLITQQKNDDVEDLLERINDIYITQQKYAELNLISYFYRILLKVFKIEESKSLLNDNNFSDIYSAIMYLEDNYMRDVSTDDLAHICRMSVAKFRRVFKSYKNMSPMKYKMYMRIKHAKSMLESGLYMVSEVSELVGCVDSAHFNRLYKSFLGKNPSEDKNRLD